ncbi:PREDICTED: lipolysis-stimulated lipoprotein receptor-like [Sturnus vulgaris]|uniref:lipolysis-stimulated lipoprotein receptor-like n=1 Tax=Sturnus vulgaris TaxID=9172 RepID=UPI00071A7212|nr:PREDICTED: lipolysis-stimulated lipoprotein receptor-like [Sturnus vulgaris]
MAAALGALLALLGVPLQVCSLQVSVPEPRTVALLFQPVLLRCQFQVSSPGPPPIVTWKYKSFCPDTSGASPGDTWGSPGDAAGACPDSARTVRIVATKQGEQVTLGDFYLGRPVTIRGGVPLQVCSLQVSVPEPRTVALLFQPVLLRCQFQVSSPGPPPIVTWKYKSFCPDTSGASPGDTWGSPGDAAGACPDSARTVRIVATKQGEQVTLGDFYLGRPVTIRGVLG